MAKFCCKFTSRILEIMIKLYLFILLFTSAICTSQNSLKINYDHFGITSKMSEEINFKSGYIEFFHDKIKIFQDGKVEIMEIKKILTNYNIELKNSGKVFFESKDKNELLILKLNNVQSYFYFKAVDKQNVINFYNNKFSKFSTLSIKDCGCKTFKMDDKKIIQCPPYPIILNEKYQIAISVTLIENKKFIMLTARFINSVSTSVNSDLMIFTTGNNILNLKLLDTTKDFVAGSEISHAKFELTDKNIEILKSEQITDIRFTFLNDEIHKSHEIKDNNDSVYNQLNCLK